MCSEKYTQRFADFPKPIAIFGLHESISEQEKFQELTTVLSKFAFGSNQALQFAQQHIHKFSTAATVTSKLAIVGTILTFLVGEVDQLYKKMKQVEQKVFSLIIEGKLLALSGNISRLQNPFIPEGQMVAEIVIAVSNLTELLPLFSNPESIYREQYYSGAPLFVRLSTILGGISLLAEETQGYDAADLMELKQKYRDLLEWYKRKCISGRMASCYVKDLLRPWVYDWDRLYNDNKEFYDGTPSLPIDYLAWNTYAEDLGGTGWRVWYGLISYFSIVDTWDPRSHDEVEFEPAEVSYTAWFVGAEGEIKRNALQEYRRRVQEIMLQFFNAPLVLLQ